MGIIIAFIIFIATLQWNSIKHFPDVLRALDTLSQFQGSKESYVLGILVISEFSEEETEA